MEDKQASGPLPDYALADRLVLTTPSQVRALGHPLRTSILQMLHERAGTVTELAGALQRPKSTVAHHVEVLHRAGLLQVVRTRRVRAIEERFYGRAARTIVIGAAPTPGGLRDGDFNDFEVAAHESADAFARGELWGFIRSARISREQAGQFWDRMAALVAEFEQLPRGGDTVYGFALGIYPTDRAHLPPAAPPADDDHEEDSGSPTR